MSTQDLIMGIVAVIAGVLLIFNFTRCEMQRQELKAKCLQEMKSGDLCRL